MLGNAWFRCRQKSTEQIAVLKQFRNFILIYALNVTVDITLTYKTRSKESICLSICLNKAQVVM